MKFIQYIFPFDEVDKGSKIIIYGAGEVGKQFINQNKDLKYFECLFIVDKNYNKIKQLNGISVCAPNQINASTFDKIVIASANKREEIYELLLKMGVDPVKIVNRHITFVHEENVSSPDIKNSLKNEQYTERAPSVDNAIKIFEGAWASILPIDDVETGYAELFRDDRIVEWNRLYPVLNKKVLELGPLECGHSYMLEKLGASSITSIESNSISYLKCLIVKDIFDLHLKLLHGDFREYLRDCDERFDIILASGVLYHMVDPVQLLRDICRLTDVIFLWTHYYSHERHDILHKFDKEPILMHDCCKAFKYNYFDSSDNTMSFCGGSKPYAFWLEKEDILDVLKNNGFSDITILEDNAKHPNGNYFTVLARKSDSL